MPLSPLKNSLSVCYHIRHVTEYRYSSFVALSHQLLHLAPRVCDWQNTEWHACTIAPAPSRQIAALDAFGNSLTRLDIAGKHDALLVSADSVVLVKNRSAGLPLQDSLTWEAASQQLAFGGVPSEQIFEAQHFRCQSPFVGIKSVFRNYAAGCFPRHAPILTACADLMRKIHGDLTFDPRASTVTSRPEDTLAQRRGVCQDYAHLMIACLRSLGLAARYVSGYLLTTPPPGAPRLIGADASHAWVSVYCPPHGWIDFDPTNNLLPDLQHITLAWGRDFADVSPIRGVIHGGGGHDLRVEVTVTPL